MAPPRQCRVLRCCSCGLFQAHQEKKSLKWTCKACGQKQSFLRAYGEGSGADCRRHVQKLNLLQGQVSEMSFRSPEAPTNSSGEETAGPWQGERACPQACLEKGAKLVTNPAWAPYPWWFTDGGVVSGLPLAAREEPEWRERARDAVPSGPPHLASTRCCHAEEHAGLAGVRGGHRHKDWDTRELTALPGQPCPTQHARSTYSKWEPFLLTPANSPRVEKGLPRTQTPREGHLSRPLHVSQLPGATHTSTSWGIDPPAKGVSGTQELLPMQLHDLFTTGEDFDVNL
ncbi:MRN complex-interacting protein isoform X5 [Manis pentadactyla]|uniref:MRN complex-interacting protein isoform X5 n=1 Tax=Manis pentadactyla TaxID=143292 RepID=UPI00255CCFB5|nr:MRN complex-interacting protein isoform X5 [Manis pentadactyla]